MKGIITMQNMILKTHNAGDLKPETKVFLAEEVAKSILITHYYLCDNECEYKQNLRGEMEVKE